MPALSLPAPAVRRGTIAPPRSLKKQDTIMGKIKRGILGGFTGRVGTVVGSTWKDVSYMRALALSVNNPRTPKQQAQRSKLSVSMAFLRAIVPYVRVGYRSLARQCTAFNAAMSYIMRHAIGGEAPQLEVDYLRALVARGTLMPVFDATATLADGTLTFAWKDNSFMGDALPGDLAMPLVFNKKRGEAVYDLDAATRADATLQLELPEGWADEPLAVYLAFRSEDEARVTNSVCLKNDAYDASIDKPATGGDSAGTGGNTGGTGGEDGGGVDENPFG